MDVGVYEDLSAVLQRTGGLAGPRLLGDFALAADEVLELDAQSLVRTQRDGAVCAVQKNRFAGLGA